jgi:uncharacterized protein (TIGR03067 family)
VKSTPLFLTVSLALLWGRATADPAADKLQGVWTVTAAERNGEPNDSIKGDTLTVKGDTFLIKGKDGDMKGTLKLGANNKLLTADFIHMEGLSKGKTMLALYEVSAEDCKFCFAPPDSKERPTELSAKAGSKNFLVILRREKK